MSPLSSLASASSLLEQHHQAVAPSPNKRPKSDVAAVLSPSSARISKLKLSTPKRSLGKLLRLPLGSKECSSEGTLSGAVGGDPDEIGFLKLPPHKRPLKLTLNVKRTLM